MLDMGECRLMDVDYLPSAVHLSPVPTPPPSNDGPFMFVALSGPEWSLPGRSRASSPSIGAMVDWGPVTQ